jgi:hypothetical protein
MYQHAQNLHELVMSSPSVVIDLGPEELEAYLLAMNCLSLIDSKDAWILMPADVGQSVCSFCPASQLDLLITYPAI